jgi:hypothetical protein
MDIMRRIRRKMGGDLTPGPSPEERGVGIGKWMGNVCCAKEVQWVEGKLKVKDADTRYWVLGTGCWPRLSGSGNLKRHEDLLNNHINPLHAIR